MKEKNLNYIAQWYSTWGMHTPGGIRNHLTAYVKLKKKKFRDKH
jgi:hypothetical protein